MAIGSLKDDGARVIVGDAAVLADHLTQRLNAVVAARAEGTRWSLAVPGGSVAERLLARLATAPLPWSRADVFFVDERCVPADDPESNWRLCRTITAGTPLDDARWHRLAADSTDPTSAADEYVRTIQSAVGPSLELDVALLGVGEDGHVASIFPGRPLLRATDATVALESDAPRPPRCRLSMTIPLLARAHLTSVAAFGASKQEVVRTALAGDGILPVTRLLRTCRTLLVLVDPEAAGGRV